MRADRCETCAYFWTGLQCNGIEIGYHGTCANRKSSAQLVDVDDLCKHYRAAEWVGKVEILPYEGPEIKEEDRI